MDIICIVGRRSVLNHISTIDAAKGWVNALLYKNIFFSFFLFHPGQNNGLLAFAKKLETGKA